MEKLQNYLKDGVSISRILNPISVALAAIIWGSLGIFVKSIDLSSVTITFFRVIFGSLGILVILILTSSIKSLKLNPKKKYIPVFFMSLFYTVNWVLFFQAIKETTVSNAVLSYHTAPTFMAILGFFFLKEKYVPIGLLL